MKAIRLQTEYLITPIGIDIKAPRFYWNCEGGINQTAYQIIAERSASIVWDSKKVLSNRMTHIKYEGPSLNSRDIITWKVKLWDENDTEGEWSPSSFEMGLLNKDDWKAKWITGDYKPQKNHRYPVDCFQKTFTSKKNIAKARLYITACGLYEATLNGEKIGTFSFAPGCTDYRTRIQYQTYDVTSMLQNQNLLEIALADGWYRGSIGCFGPTNVFGRQTKLLSQLEIVYADGTNEIITSDESFSWSNDGPIRFADLKDGEIYDTAMLPTYRGKAKVTSEKIVPTASNNVEVCEKERLQAKMILTPSGKKVLDFGQNIAGVIEFTVKGQKGQKIKLRFGEILDENGEMTQKNIQAKKPAKEFGSVKLVMVLMGQEKNPLVGKIVPTPKQEVEFICSGGTDHYKTTFAVFGFQYAEVETEVTFDVTQFYAVAVYSDMEQTGSFTCSNAMVNRFVENTTWSMKGNFLDIPSDCPTRERLGWTGDAQIFFNTGAYLMNTAAFYKKWLVDMADGQYKDGRSSAVIPYAGAELVYKNTGGSVGWADAAVLVPYRYWKRFGDRSILSDFYPMMRKLAEYMMNHTGLRDKKAAAANPYNKYAYEKGMHLGEWLEPKEFMDTKMGGKNYHPEEATAYLHYTMTILTEIAKALGKTEDEALFHEYADGAIKAYDYMFLKDSTIDTDRQAKLVRPLALGLLDSDKKKNVQERLVKAVENYHYCVGTGFLSTVFVLPTLTEAGRSDVAYKMLENETAPSWLSEVKTGATTVWEDWEGGASHNHYSPGAVCEWLFNTVAGINVAGENRFEISPIPGGTLEHACAEYNSPYGKVKSSWQMVAGEYLFECEIPSNTSARVILPNGETHEITSGKYNY